MAYRATAPDRAKGAIYGGGDARPITPERHGKRMIAGVGGLGVAPAPFATAEPGSDLQAPCRPGGLALQRREKKAGAEKVGAAGFDSAVYAEQVALARSVDAAARARNMGGPAPYAGHHGAAGSVGVGGDDGAGDHCAAPAAMMPHGNNNYGGGGDDDDEYAHAGGYGGYGTAIANTATAAAAAYERDGSPAQTPRTAAHTNGNGGGSGGKREPTCKVGAGGGWDPAAYQAARAANASLAARTRAAKIGAGTPFATSNDATCDELRQRKPRHAAAANRNNSAPAPWGESA